MEIIYNEQITRIKTYQYYGHSWFFTLWLDKWTEGKPKPNKSKTNAKNGTKFVLQEPINVVVWDHYT